MATMSAKGGCGSLEDGHRADVHVADVVLDVEERGVQRAQPVSAHGPLPSPGTAMAQCSGRYHRAGNSPGDRPGPTARRRRPRLSRRRRPGRLAQAGQERAGEDPVPGLFVGRLDHPRRPVLGHGPQPHGVPCLGRPAPAGSPWCPPLRGGRSRVPGAGARTSAGGRPGSAARPCEADMEETTITVSRCCVSSTSALVFECTPPSKYSTPSMVIGVK